MAEPASLSPPERAVTHGLFGGFGNLLLSYRQLADELSGDQAHRQTGQEPILRRGEATMSDQSKTIATAAIRRIQLTRRPPRREALPDTTLTESWPPRLNTQL